MRIALVILAILGLMGCGSGDFASNEINVSQTGWRNVDKIDITFNVSDSTQTFDLVTRVIHDVDYEFQNLYINVINVMPNGDTLQKPVSLNLGDKKGTWQGKCNGGVCRAEVVLQQDFYFPLKGDYLIAIAPYMRVDPVPGLESIELALVSKGKR